MAQHNPQEKSLKPESADLPPVETDSVKSSEASESASEGDSRGVTDPSRHRTIPAPTDGGGEKTIPAPTDDSGN